MLSGKDDPEISLGQSPPLWPRGAFVFCVWHRSRKSIMPSPLPSFPFRRACSQNALYLSYPLEIESSFRYSAEEVKMSNYSPSHLIMTHDLSLPLLHALLGAISGAFCLGFSGLSKKRLCKVRQSVCFRRVRVACSLRRNRPNFLGSNICYAHTPAFVSC